MDELERVLVWLTHKYCIDEDGGLSKRTVYEDYVGLCQGSGIKPTCAPAFGKMVRKAFPTVVSNRKLDKDGTSRHCYKNLICKAPAHNNFACDAPTAIASQKAEASEVTLGPCSESPLAQSFGYPRMMPFFAQLQSEARTLGLEFAQRYQAYWQRLYDDIFFDPSNLRAACVEFWESLAFFAAISKNHEIRSACNAADKQAFEELSSLLMTNPKKLHFDLWTRQMVVIAHLLPLLVHNGLYQCLLDTNFVFDRIQAVHDFSEVVFKKVIVTRAPDACMK